MNSRSRFILNEFDSDYDSLSQVPGGSYFGSAPISDSDDSVDEYDLQSKITNPQMDYYITNDGCGSIASESGSGGCSSGISEEDKRWGVSCE